MGQNGRHVGGQAVIWAAFKNGEVNKTQRWRSSENKEGKESEKGAITREGGDTEC